MSYWHGSYSFSIWLDLESLRWQTWGSLFKGGLTGKIHPSCGQHHLLRWRPGLNKKEKAGYHVHLCFWDRHDVTSGLLFLPLCLPPSWNTILKMGTEKPLLSSRCFCLFLFLTARRKVRHTHLAYSFASLPLSFRLPVTSLTSTWYPLDLGSQLPVWNTGSGFFVSLVL